MYRFFNKLFYLEAKEGYYSIMAMHNSKEKAELGKLEGSLVESIVYADGRVRRLFEQYTQRPLDQIALSPDGEHIAYVRYDTNELWLYQIKYEISRILYKGDLTADAPCINGIVWMDANTLLINLNGGEKGLFLFPLSQPPKKLWDTGKGDPFAILAANPRFASAAFTANGRNELQIYRDGKIKRTSIGKWIDALQISPDSEKIAIIEQSYSLGSQLKIICKDLPKEINFNLEAIYDLVWEKDSEQLFLVKGRKDHQTNQYEVWIADLQSRQIFRKTRFQYELDAKIDFPEGVIHSTPRGGGLLLLDSLEPYILDPDSKRVPISEDLTYFLGWI